MVTDWGHVSADSHILQRLSKVRLVLTDCDGCLTDGGVFVSAEGETMKRFSILDGMGFARLRAAGIAAGIVTGEFSPAVGARARKLSLDEVLLGISEKGPALEEVAARRGLAPEAIAYFGDDCNDLPVFPHVGFFACPGDAFVAIRDKAHWISPRPGGYGAFRDFAELCLRARG